MNGTRWQPAHSVINQVQQLQQEMNRLFGRLGENGARALGLTAYPAVNLWEDTEQIFVEAELPGLELKDLEIYVSGDQLTIKGERKATVVEKGIWHRQERSVGSFVRALTLPTHVDADKVDARLENGVLLVKLPKNESAKPRKIMVKGE